MFSKKLTLLLSVLIFMSVNVVSALVSDNCMRTLDLESKNPPEKKAAKIADCILNELVKRGVTLCDSKCLEKLTPEQLDQYLDNRFRQTRKIIDEELARRKSARF